MAGGAEATGTPSGGTGGWTLDFVNQTVDKIAPCHLS